ncbi:Eaa1 [Klebsiella pneumoniae]|nr:Eaa1 [Klebsiella pneumoniae]SAU02309.1 Eaa1 [Klebsiella pneumoniae]SWM12342.1 Eaa1 [Klebsiella pneumoniae]
MTKSTITRERLQEIAEDGFLKHGESKELARMALAALDSEPVALQPELAKVIYHFRDWNEGFPVERFKADYVISWMLANYPPAQPAKDREQVRREHAEWSQATFGNVGPVGPLKHLSKEALEAAAEPGDLSEWADMQFLLWDAQRRAGITDEQITQAMIDKLAVNKQREWPEPKDGEPRLHIKEQPAPVVPDELLKEYLRLVQCMLSDYRDGNYGNAQRWIRHIAKASDDFERKHGISPWEMARKTCRAAMPQELQKSAGADVICRSNENAQAVEVQSLTSINPAPDLVSLQKKAESIIGNYPGIPDCWCRTCRPVVLNDMRFVVCPDCGNKRCPRANDHRNACTGSNEPGQEGSAYPDTLQEPKP